MEDDLDPDLVAWEIQDVLDLHSFPPSEVRDLVTDYLDLAFEMGFDRVRIIHGKGRGVQRSMVRKIATRHPDVERVAEPTLGGGGWGATVVIFRDRSAS